MSNRLRRRWQMLLYNTPQSSVDADIHSISRFSVNKPPSLCNFILVSPYLPCKDLHFTFDHCHKSGPLLSAFGCLVACHRCWCVLRFLPSSDRALGFSGACTGRWRVQYCRMIIPTVTVFNPPGGFGLLPSFPSLVKLWGAFNLCALIGHPLRSAS